MKNKPIISLHKVTLEGETAMNLSAQLKKVYFNFRGIGLDKVINIGNSFCRDGYLHFLISLLTVPLGISLKDIENKALDHPTVFIYHPSVLSVLIDLGPHVKIDLSKVRLLGSDVYKEWICNEVSYIVMASENEPERHEKKYVYFNQKSKVKIVTPQAPHFIKERVFEFDPKGLCIEFNKSEPNPQNNFYVNQYDYLVDNSRKAKEKVYTVYYWQNNQYPYFENLLEVKQSYFRLLYSNIDSELNQIKRLQKLNKNGCELTSSYLEALNILEKRKYPLDKLKESKQVSRAYSEQGESKKFIGNGLFNIEKKDIRNIYRSDYVPFFMLPLNKYSYTLATMHLSDAELSLLEVTPYDLEKVVVAVGYGDDLKPNSIYLINRDPLDRGDVVKLELNNETSEDKDKISIKINRNSLSGKIYVPAPSGLSLTDLQEKSFDLNTDIFETIKGTKQVDIPQNDFNRISTQKILTPFIGALIDKPMDEFTEEESLFVQKIIRREIFNIFQQNKMKSLSEMDGLIYDQSIFTIEFIEILRKRKDFPFTNPQSTMGAFVKIAKSMENHRWCLDLKTGELRIDSSAVPNNPDPIQ